MSDTTPIKRNPYPGLRSFEQEDQDVFFGRQSDADRIFRRLDSVRFLSVVGPPGSGKSSLVRAGLVPALRRDGAAGAAWRIVTVRPGAGLLRRLAHELVRVFPSSNILDSESVRRDRLAADLHNGAQALIDTVMGAARSGAERCLVVVDPFDELFYFGDPGENATFVEMLLEVTRDDSVPMRVLVTLGSDFVGDCAHFKGLPAVLHPGLHPIPPLGQAQLREAVESPARVSGGTIAGELVDRILHDVEKEQEPLPALQYVLRRIWESGDSFGLAEYESMGGLTDAVSGDADRVMGELSEEEGRLARKVFQCITYKVPEHRGVSWPTRLAEVAQLTDASEASVRRVIDRFRAPNPGFVVPRDSEPVAPDSLIAISHDSLIRKWKTLHNWIDEEYAVANLYRALVRSAELHAQGREGIWRGPALGLAAEKIERKEWSSKWADRLGGNYYSAISFFEESLRAGEPSAPGGEVTKSYRWARVSAGIFGLLFIASLGVVVYVYERQRDAVAQRQEAERLPTEARQQSVAGIQGLSRAELEKAEADRQRRAAIRQKERAERQQKITESRLRIAENQQRIAASQQTSGKTRDESESQRLYVASMNLANRAFEEGDFVRGQEFLEEYLPPTAPGQSDASDDVRDFFWYYLWRENHDEMATLRGHTNTVSAVAFSPDGKSLATAGRDGNVKLWNPVTRQALGTLKGSGSALSAVVFSPDGKLVGAASRDGSVTLWDAGSRRELATMAADGGNLLAMTFTRDGRNLILGGKDGDVSVWDVETRTKLASLEGHERDIYAVAVSPDGRTLATGSQDDTVKLWDLRTRKEIATLEGKGDDVYAAAFSPDGSLLATGDKNGSVKLWEVTSRKNLATLDGTGGDIYALAFSPDGRVLAAGGRDGTLELWDVATRTSLDVLKGHRDSVVAAAFAPEGQLLVTGSRDSTVKLWRPDLRQARATLSGKTPVFAVAFEPGGKRLATGSVADTVRVWNLETREESMVLKGSGDVLFAVAFSPDGTLLATGSKDGTAKLWNVSTGKETAVLKGHGAVVFSAAFSPDGKTLATGSWDHTVKLWNVASGREQATLKGHDDAVFSVAFSPDGKILATGSKDTTVKLWDTTTGEELATLTGHGDAVFPVAFSPDGALLVTASRDGVVKLWNVESREEVDTLRGHLDSVSSVSFSPDGRVLATGSLDDSVKLWDLETHRELATLKGHAKDVYSVAFSPDGRLLATGSLDGTVKLWERATDAEVATQK